VVWFFSHEKLTIALSSNSCHYLSIRKNIPLAVQVIYSVLLIQLIFPFSLLGIELHILVKDFVFFFSILTLMGK